MRGSLFIFCCHEAARDAYIALLFFGQYIIYSPGEVF